MAWRRIKLLQNLVSDSGIIQIRCYSSKVDWSNRRPMIRKRIENRAKDYPICDMIPVAEEVLQARNSLIEGVSILMQAIPVQACKFCPEVFVGEQGHSIQTCCGFRRIGKNRVHEWIPGGFSDVLVPVETFRLDHMFQNVIKHDQRFDFDRVNAVVELCRQAGADVNIVNDCHNVVGSDRVERLSLEQLRLTAKWTLKFWETVRLGVKRLLLVYPAKKCVHCSEVHVGPSGHMARLCGIFKYESWRGTHYWKKASVDDLVPLKMVWCRRPQDPPVLLNKHRDFYGHAPAVVDLCSKAGIVVPKKYNCMMKLQGISAPLMS